MEKRLNTQDEQKEPRKGYTIRTQFNPEYQGCEGSKPSPVKKTVPDMSLTIAELVRNHTRGISVDINQPEPVFFEDPIPTIQDLTDLDALRATLEERAKETLDLKEKSERQAAKAAKIAYEQSIIEKHEKSKQKPEPGSDSVIPT